MPIRTGDANRGRIELTAIVVVPFLISLAIGIGAWWRSGVAKPATLVAQPLAMVVLGVLVANGQRWARILLSIWFALFALTDSYGAIVVAGVSSLAGITILAAGLVFAAAAFRLIASDDIDEFVARGKQAAGPDKASAPGG